MSCNESVNYREKRERKKRGIIPVVRHTSITASRGACRWRRGTKWSPELLRRARNVAAVRELRWPDETEGDREGGGHHEVRELTVSAYARSARGEEVEGGRKRAEPVAR